MFVRSRPWTLASTYANIMYCNRVNLIQNVHHNGCGTLGSTFLPAQAVKVATCLPPSRPPPICPPPVSLSDQCLSHNDARFVVCRTWSHHIRPLLYSVTRCSRPRAPSHHRVETHMACSPTFTRYVMRNLGAGQSCVWRQPVHMMVLSTAEDVFIPCAYL
jgi:hypothetical protein